LKEIIFPAHTKVDNIIPRMNIRRQKSWELEYSVFTIFIMLNVNISWSFKKKIEIVHKSTTEIITDISDYVGYISS
jgi:hypothetical protein